jgi:uncharacterized membrane protein
MSMHTFRRDAAVTKLDFLNALERGLQQLPQEERERHLSYYSEMLDDMMEDGMDEQQAVGTLGDVQTIAGQILQETALPVLVKSRVKPKNGWNVERILLLIVGAPIWIPLLLTLLCVILSVYICIWAVFLALFAAAGSIAVSGLAVMAVPWLTVPVLPLADTLLWIGCGLILVGLGILACLGVFALSKGFVRLTVLFARWVRTLFIRKEAVQ